MKLVETVLGYVATWRIYEDEDGFYNVCNKRYGNIDKAKQAIRIAERRYVEKNPTAPVANTHIWFEHGILICDDFDGGYYE